MTDNPDWTIVQLIPATGGWMAEYSDAKGKMYEPVVAWALLERPDGEQRIAGYEASDMVYCCEDADNFVKYRSPA